jgi:Tfp pilus assembly protein PilF
MVIPDHEDPAALVQKRYLPDYANAFANRAEAYQKRRDYQRAARDYDEAIRLAPNLNAVWNGRCWAGRFWVNCSRR